ncbi:response regulator transcription factor [Nitratiruptor sp. SB155-2]|uniref:response regulator transcription factor n=1 Tax=Nitratiruptor sp. (strain SB155-2) TaxID=387092 RepID=UPI0001586D07|nr:response regulator transcription factor [Nitratiruptor sp. SB155-2]BAF69641.1 two-component response regulator [Nitratiruptor sp. SB155-2]
MKILLMEDEIILCDSIERYLEKIGHQVTTAYDGEQAFELIQQSSFDLLILDINVPNIDGFTLMELLKEHKRYTPVIFISSLTDIEDITKGFELGCKDYIKKPFHLKELELRIEKLAIQDKSHVVLSKSYSYSFEQKTLYFNNTPVTLTKRQQQIIELLAKNRGIVVDYDMFREYVYTEEFVDNPTIRAEISRLKKLLCEDFIQNIRGVGYKIDK